MGMMSDHEPKTPEAPAATRSPAPEARGESGGPSAASDLAATVSNARRSAPAWTGAADGLPSESSRRVRPAADQAEPSQQREDLRRNVDRTVQRNVALREGGGSYPRASDLGQRVQRAPNRTGLPDQLKGGVERLSGYSLDDVRVQYNSAEPAKANAHALARGTAIHIAPGQEEHLPHEAWHVVQQAQGRVSARVQHKGVTINEDRALEREADLMGAKALRMGSGPVDVLTPLPGSSGVAQLRSANPFEQAGEHLGYELTAHHIVPHSKLKLAHALLKNYDTASKTAEGEVQPDGVDDAYGESTIASSVLKSSIPSTLTESMVIKVGIFDEQAQGRVEGSWLPIIQAVLSGTKSIETVAGESGREFDEAGVLELVTAEADGPTLRLDRNYQEINNNGLEALRSSFYEWQGGNQFMGPSTDLREEPGSKDDIDFDAQWITALSAADFQQLTGLASSQHRNSSKPTGDQLTQADGDGLGLRLIDLLNGKKEDHVPSRELALAIQETLEGILDITRDITPAAFDPTQWKEVSSPAEFERLVEDEPIEEGKTNTWGRRGDGVAEHAFFRIGLNDIDAIDELTQTTSGGSTTAYDYCGTPVPGSKVKIGSGPGHHYVYLPVKGAESIKAAPQKATDTMFNTLRALEFPTYGDDAGIQIDDTDARLEFKAAGPTNRKFSLRDYTGEDVFVGTDTGTFNVSADKLGKPVSTVTPSANVETLYDFCKRNDSVTLSTFMPQGLHDHLMS